MWLLAVLWAVAGVLAVSEDPSLFWGPYRPNLYLGMRPRVPQSLLSGLMWYSSDKLEGVTRLRHDANMVDDIAKFGWTHYDPREGGRQVIRDTDHHINLTTDLIKSPDGSGWEIRIRGVQPIDQVQTMVWYTVLEGEGSINLESELTPRGIAGDAVLKGTSPELGDFRLTVTEGDGALPVSSHKVALASPANHAHYMCLSVPDDKIHRSKDIFLVLVQDEVNKLVQQIEDAEDMPVWAALALPDDDSLGGNMHYIQKSFRGPFEFRVQFNHAEADFDARLTELLEGQQSRFENSVDLQPPFDSQVYRDFAREVVSSLNGGLGYFWGDSLVGDPEDSSIPATNAPPHELFTLTPSRPFFPRGFYWDEGFHLLALHQYDVELALEITNSWFDAMDEDGWIAREQILGPEARARVPSEFQVQVPSYANPPTPVMFLAHLGKDFRDERVRSHLENLYPKLQTHFNWFRRTQHGDIVEFDRDFPTREAYRWRGRSPTHVLTSGMDDYPRASDPSDGELHVDLLSWIGAMAESLAHIAEGLGHTADAEEYTKIRHNVMTNLAAVHWDKEHQMFCDLTVDEYEEDLKVCHDGYVTLLPLMLRLVDPTSSEKLLPILERLRDPEQLWSRAGIRSLSKQDRFFGTSENYWRGPVWIQMNYLLLDALRFYAEEASPEVSNLAATIYHDLRIVSAQNVYDQWRLSGYVWEQYDGLTGAAKGAKQFTGWTALAASMMSMPESVGPAAVSDPVQPVEEPVNEDTVNEDIVDDDTVHEDL